jgi:hypothetical protein
VALFQVVENGGEFTAMLVPSGRSNLTLATPSVSDASAATVTTPLTVEPLLGEVIVMTGA